MSTDRSDAAPKRRFWGIGRGATRKPGQRLKGWRYTYESIEATLLALVTDDASAAEVYSAMYDVAWVPLGSGAETYSEAFELADQEREPWPFTWTAKNAGDLVGGARGKGEGWQELICELPVEAGVVSERVRRVMEALGLRPVL